MPKSGCTLGIDHGASRIGLAMSDPSGRFALPLDVVPFASFFKRIPEIIQEYNVDHVVVGMPLTLRGEPGPEADKVGKFVERLRVIIAPITIDTFDERLTSKQAESMSYSKKSKQKSDALAASIMLDCYLARRKNTAAP